MSEVINIKELNERIERESATKWARSSWARAIWSTRS